MDAERIAHEPWLAVYDEQPSEAQRSRQADLRARPGYRLHERCFVAEDAHVVADRFGLGDGSFVAAGCLIRGDVTVGEHCSLNSGATTIGKVTIGDFVRIASYAVLVGENHVFTDPEVPIAWQGLTTEGVVIEDDVWIGAHATVVDGVTVGAHSVVAAGAVVTRDVEPWSVVAGVPARKLRDRRQPEATGRGAQPLTRFDATVAEQWPDVLARCRARHEGVDTYVDTVDAEWGPRALNDAIEIAGAFGEVPPVADRAELVARIQALQDRETGLFIDPRLGPPDDPLTPSHREWDMYGIISCGYALEVLGAGPAHPIHAVEACDATRLEGLLDGLDWEWLAWGSGSWIDAFGTAIHLNRRHHGSTRTHPVLWGWLATHVRRTSGMWGDHLDPAGEWDLRWLMAVNGYYRMTRGTYAQFGVPLPHPERALDTVLAHGGDWGWFEDRERNACNVLDVIHPLWLLSHQTDHRRGEVRDVAARILLSALDDWVDGEGVAWDVHQDRPGLQGTEMWLSITHLACAVLDEADGLSWTPRGVHRLPPAGDLA